MWRLHHSDVNLPEQSSAMPIHNIPPASSAAPAQNASAMPMHSRFQALRHALHDVVHPSASRCSVCHVELNDRDKKQGFCSDIDGCSCRAFSARCW